MRTKNSIRNMAVTLVMNFITIIAGFIAQKIFLNLLGSEYLGLNGLFTNVVSMLGIVELGLGSAIIYHLYKPIAEKDINTIKSLMQFYKKSYHLIALVVFLLGLILIPFLPLFVKDVTVSININLAYFLFVIDIVFSYLLSYKRSILYANEQNYIINIIHIFYTIFLNVFQLSLLYVTKNYYIYLVIKIIMRIAENVVITKVANKKYSYLKEKNIKELEDNLKEDIYKKIKALFFHKIGTFIVLGTDNIIISKFLGIITVGLYSNYAMIFSALQTLISQTLTALTPSIGSLLIEKNEKKNFDIFKKVRFLNFVVVLISSTALLLMMDIIIKVWIGKEYILPPLVLIVLIVNFYQSITRTSYSVFKEADGVFYEDRYVPLIESTINVIASIILVKLFGLAGVFMGTIMSSLILWGYSYPKFVYKKIFKRTYREYIKETLGYLLLFIITMWMALYLSNQIMIEHVVLAFCYKLTLSVLIPIIMIVVVFHHSDYLKYLKEIVKSKK